MTGEIVDHLIIGQGLAGSLLGWELIRRNKSVVIIDNGHENASLIAAGLINPISGMRLVKAAGLDQYLQSALHCYTGLEKFFRRQFYIEKPMLRLLRSASELQSAEKRLEDTQYQAYLGQIVNPIPATLHSPWGLLQQKKTGYLLTQAVLNALKQFFIERHCYYQASVDYNRLQLEPMMQWRHISARNIIFCEGHLGAQNPWFKQLPFTPVKGEILTAESTVPVIQNLLNYGHWLIPLDQYHFKTGATFDRDRLDTLPSPAARKLLFYSLYQYYPGMSQSRVINHQAGIRPATADRQPFIGVHPSHAGLFIFNGFGSKGSLLIPYFSRLFADYLADQAELPDCCNIKRYYVSHFPG